MVLILPLSHRGVTTILGPTLGLGSSQLVLEEMPWAQGADVEGRLQNELAGPAFPRNTLRTHIYYFFLRLSFIMLSKAV